MGLSQQIFWRLHQFWHRYYEKPSLKALDAFDPKLVNAMRDVSEAAGLTDFRCTRQSDELLSALQKYKPKNIVELGSGRSTLILAAYAAQTSGVNVLSFEQDAGWLEIVNRFAEKYYGLAPAVVAEVSPTEAGGRYTREIPLNTDFIYIDGPFIEEKQSYNNKFGKAEYADVPDLLMRGGKPAFILCEGRLDTVDAILRTETAKGSYRFQPSFFWHYFLGKFQNPFRYTWHSSFERFGKI